MTSLFGYMIVMIFLKWCKDWNGIENRAPSIITLLMNIFLKLGSVVRN
jgi:V-type ATPase 116kDa subunit family